MRYLAFYHIICDAVLGQSSQYLFFANSIDHKRVDLFARTFAQIGRILDTFAFKKRRVIDIIRVKFIIFLSKAKIILLLELFRSNILNSTNLLNLLTKKHASFFLFATIVLNQLHLLSNLTRKPITIWNIVLIPLFHCKNSTQSAATVNYNVIQRTKNLTFKNLHKRNYIDSQKQPNSFLNLRNWISEEKIFALLFACCRQIDSSFCFTNISHTYLHRP